MELEGDLDVSPMGVAGTVQVGMALVFGFLLMVIVLFCEVDKGVGPTMGK